MRLIRSWPAALPEGRSHVQDGVERLVMDGYDYTALGDYDDDILLLEWDIAVGREDLHRFATDASRRPGRVLVAPYRLYPEPGGVLEQKWRHRLDEHGSIWVHLRYDGLWLEPVDTGEPYCQNFGFGMIYLPRGLVRGYLDMAGRYEKMRRLSDSSFSMWHYHHVQPDVPICWDVRPVHLHYDITTIELRQPEKVLEG